MVFSDYTGVITHRPRKRSLILLIPFKISVFCRKIILNPLRITMYLQRGETNAEIFSLPTAPRGVHTLGVAINGIHQDYKRYGLGEAKLLEHVAQQLEEAGFNLIPAEETWSSPSAALLRVDLNLVYSYLGYSYAISVKLVQKIKLAGPQGKLVPVITWSTGRSGFLRAPEISYLYDYITAAVEQFIKAAQSSR
jgi:hypothetical protein